MAEPHRLARRMALRLGLCLLGLALSVQAQGVQVQDERGQTVSLKAPAQRVVSLLPSLTETVCALGACARLVGVDRYSNFPVSVKSLPQMGGGLDPQIERIVAAQPDVVLMAASARGAERLEALGLKVVVLEPQNHASAERAMRSLAAVLGLPSENAQTLWRRMVEEVQAAGRSLPAQRKAWRVYMEVGPAPHGASESSFLGETLALMGPGNILPGRLGAFPRINPEWVVKADPDLMMLTEGSLDEWKRRPGWASLSAVRAGRVCTFRPEDSDVLLRPGPRMADAARRLAQCIQQVPGKGA